MKTLIRPVLFAGLLVSSQVFAAQLYFDPGFGHADPNFGDDDVYLKLGVGFDMNRYWDFDAGYLDLLDDMDVDGFYSTAKGKFRVNRNTKLYVKGGLYMWDAPGDDGLDLMYGGGVTFERIGLGHINVEVLKTEVMGNNNVTMIGASYSIPIGR
jgi:hypothetical protein